MNKNWFLVSVYVTPPGSLNFWRKHIVTCSFHSIVIQFLLVGILILISSFCYLLTRTTTTAYPVHKWSLGRVEYMLTFPLTNKDREDVSNRALPQVKHLKEVWKREYANERSYNNEVQRYGKQYTVSPKKLRMIDALKLLRLGFMHFAS